MRVTLVVPAALRSCADGLREVALEGATLGGVLDDLAQRLPVLERRLRDERGHLRPHVLVFVDGVMVGDTPGLDTPVDDGTEVFIAPAVSGGRPPMESSSTVR
ncbi:MAG TPA: MoaD/ThiS family protein [Candidatus Dormibacteraeota bacterium]|jgi:molybdopterin converting factor small subunit